MDKYIFGLSPGVSYKVRWTPQYPDGTSGAPSIAYTITAPNAPNPAKVDQDTISVDSQSLAEGIIISWDEPTPDASLPEVSDYFVQITDDLNDWQKFEISSTETKIIFTENNHNVFFGYFAPIIYIRVFSRGSNKQFAPLDPEEYYEYSYAVESGLRPPDIFTASVPGAYRYNLSWAYLPERPDVVDRYKIYEASLDGLSYGLLIATINDENESEYDAGPLIALGGQTLRFAITALDLENNESPPKYSNVITIGLIDVDFDAPPQRENINFDPDPNSANVIATWTNTGPAADEVLNSDLAGVTIRYALSSDPTNYFWQDIPFKYSDNVTSATIFGLLPNTSYQFQLSTFDVLFNRTAYSAVDSVVTQKDNIPPPKPAPPAVSGGTGTEAMIVRVFQFGAEPDGNIPDLGTGTPLPPDTSYFQVWMLNNAITQSPTGANNPQATLIGDMPAGFNGIETQKIFYVSSVPSGELRYFYTRAVDTSGNISVASDPVQSTALVYFGDAHVDRLSAGKLKAGSIQSDTTITVGTGVNSIKIDGNTGSIYSGFGSYSNQNTGFYLDDSGTFSLKNRLVFDGTTLSVTGNIEAQSGFFTGNVGVTGSGSLFAGTSPSGGVTQPNSVVINSGGIIAKNSDNETTFLLSSNGSLELSGFIKAGKAVFNETITSNPSGITSRVYFTPSSGGVASTLSGFPSVEIRKTVDSVNERQNGYISFYRPYNSSQGVVFFSNPEGGPNAIMRGAVEHGSVSSNDFEAGGLLKISAWGSSSGATPGVLRLDGYSSTTGESGEIMLSSGSLFFYREKKLPMNAQLTGSNAGILGINTLNGRVGIYANEITASARIVTSTPSDPGAFPVGALIAVV
jgi:hypothetical protein